MKKIKILIGILIITLSYQFSFGQNGLRGFVLSGTDPETIEINQTFTTENEFFPFDDRVLTIFGLALNADISLENNKSSVRVILVDKKYEEHLIYEAYSLLKPDLSFSVDKICEETCILNSVNPHSVRVEITDATITINSFTYASGMMSGTDVQRVKKEKKQAQNIKKIIEINKNLKAKGLNWVAGPTSVSEMTYAERKKLYGQSTFPLGFEYYIGGVIKTGTTSSSRETSLMVDYWDWRDRHGQNWITPITNQGQCGSCWVFAATGATEAMVNLYFNQHLDLDLSEQDVLSCSNAGDCGGGSSGLALNYITSSGVVDEATFPYTATDQPCINKGTNPSELIKIGGRISEYTRTEDDLKRMIIEKGPISGSLSDWHHAMVLPGYQVVEEGDVFYYRDLSGNRKWKTVGAGDPLIGKTVWIFKNSWGAGFGDNGYVYVETDISNIRSTHAILTPVTSEIQDYNVVCEDSDGDGYYWWGLGEKPATCDCPDEPDGDDSDPDLGPLNEYGYCTINIIDYPRPRDLNATNITHTTADLSWTENGTATNWEIRLGIAGFDTTGLAPVSVTENPTTWEGLAPSTAYEWYVRAVCGDGDYSEWVGPSTFTTLSEGILWANCYGGSNYDAAYAATVATDGGFIIAGSTTSNDGDVSGNHGSKDVWVVKIDDDGDTIWTRTYGGSSSDFAGAADATDDGGCIVLGKTSSTDGDVHGNHFGSAEWVLKLDATGDTIWTRTFEGYQNHSSDIKSTNDGGYIIVYDSWTGYNSKITAFKLDENGNLIWWKDYNTLGKYLEAHAICETPNGSYIIVGTRYQELNTMQSIGDAIIIEVDSDGELLNTQNVDNPNNNSLYQVLYDIQQTLDGGYIAVGYTTSFVSNPENENVFIVKLNSQVEVEWSKALDAYTDYEQAYSIIQTSDSGFVATGSSDYNSFILKLNKSGEMIMFKEYGGSSFDSGRSILQSSEGGYILAGYTESNDGIVYGNHGGADFWIVKLSPDLSNPPCKFAESYQRLGVSGHTDVALGDMDNDGDLDAVVTKDGEGEPNKVWLNDGSGNFTDSGLSFGNAKSWGIALGDLDGDGDLDGFIANDGPNKVYLNNGINTADNGQNLGNSVGRSVRLADLDGDGDLDAAVANNEYGQPNKVWLNNGNGTFVAFNMDLGNGISWGLDLGDLDGDGDVDGFVSNDGPNKVYLNDGPYTSDNGQSLGFSSGKGIRLGDMDGDGDLDAVIANDGAGEPNTVWLNNGTGSFTNSGLNFGTDISMALALGDLDGDGDLDGFVANDYGPNRIYLNDGVNTTDNGQQLGCLYGYCDNSYGVALGDLDGDGDLDAFVANYYSPNKVYFNQSPPQAEKEAAGQNLSQFSLNSFEEQKEVLLDNYPNPFDRATAIRFKLNSKGRVVLRIANLYGKVVEQLYDATAEAEQEYKLEFQAGDLPAGIYVIQLESENGLKAHSKMMLLK